MYTLIGLKLASMWELKTCYTLDEALKLYALWQMTQDIEAAKAEEIKGSMSRGAQRGRRR